MSTRRFWTKGRMLPGQPAVEGTAEVFWLLKRVHPPSATAMVLGAVAGGALGWRMFRDYGTVAGLIAMTLVGFVSIWLGLLIYWLVRVALMLRW